MVTQAIDTLLCFITEFFIFSTNSILHLSAKCTNGVIKPAIALLLVTSLYSTHRVDILFPCSGELYFQTISSLVSYSAILCIFFHHGNSIILYYFTYCVFQRFHIKNSSSDIFILCWNQWSSLAFK